MLLFIFLNHFNCHPLIKVKKLLRWVTKSERNIEDNKRTEFKETDDDEHFIQICEYQILQKESWKRGSQARNMVEQTISIIKLNYNSQFQ